MNQTLISLQGNLNMLKILLKHRKENGETVGDLEILTKYLQEEIDNLRKENVSEEM